MRKIISLAAMLMMILTATAFAEEPPAEEVAEQSDAPYIYTSDTYHYSIACPFKPVGVVRNPWQESDKHGEMLVFANEGWNIQYAYLIQIDAFDTKQVPDFNKAPKITIDEYLAGLLENGFGAAELVNITKDNKGVYAVTAQTIEVVNKETGEVEGEFVAERQDAYTFFRTSAGRCISIQLISPSLEKDFVMPYRYSVASFKDLTADKKTDKKAKKDKKSKKDKK